MIFPGNNYPLAIIRGTDTIEEWTLDPDGDYTWPVDGITGYTFVAQIRVSADSDVVLVTITVDIIDAVARTIRLTLLAADAESLPLPTPTQQTLVWGITATSPGGAKQQWATGPVEVAQAVGR